jgi:protein-S-isoprenylcysteine O-methyltransferase Ste14
MALLLLALFLSFAVIGRILLQYYFTGDHGVRLAKPTAPASEIIPGLMFVLSFALSAALIVGHHFEKLEVAQLGGPVLTGLAFTLGLVGILVILVAQVQMGRSWRIGVDPSEQTELICTGLYARSRNPIYFGILLYWIGMAVTLPHPALWLCALICWASIEVIVRKIEEPYLLGLHGEKFAEYVADTRRYLPF